MIKLAVSETRRDNLFMHWRDGGVGSSVMIALSLLNERSYLTA